MAYNKPIPDGDGKRRDSGGLATLVQAEKMMQIALLLPSAAFVGWLIGAFLDSKLHTTWIAAAGIIFGGISGLVYVIRLVLSAGMDADRKPDPGKPSLDKKEKQ
jgi:ATP synthase protein I